MHGVQGAPNGAGGRERRGLRRWRGVRLWRRVRRLVSVRRSGWMRPPGWVRMGMAMGALALACPLTARAQFAPGKLSRAHAALGGPLECLHCHEPRRATTAERCLACHRELASRIAAGGGFHGRLDATQRSRCGTCHAEHGGEEAPLVLWPGGKRESFDHRRTGYPLTGKHTSLGCGGCHKPERIGAEDVRASKNLNLASTYLGLSSRCADCHADAHHGQFAARVDKEDCAGCHGTASWAKARFDHATARYPLAGRHASLACEKCHLAADASGAQVAAGTPGAFVRYRPLGFESCADCHADPHRGKLGLGCAGCHSVEGWKQVDLARFDHARTRYPLVGKHHEVECAGCHYSVNASGKRVAVGAARASVRYKPLAFGKCTDCHEDPHREPLGPDCARCHSTAGWLVITAGTFDHDRTRYPLRGRHLQVACQKCHREDSARKALTFAKCTDCHADAHRGQLVQRADREACEACHVVGGFAPARYGAAEHAASRFPLAGAHLAVPCTKCHRKETRAASASSARGSGGAGGSDFEMRFADLACAACHEDPHAGQFGAASAGKAQAGRTDCARCHGADTWRLPRFGHDKTRFPLEGAHRRATCAACHRSVTVGSRAVVRYRPLDTACRACHAEPVKSLKE